MEAIAPNVHLVNALETSPLSFVFPKQSRVAVVLGNGPSMVDSPEFPREFMMLLAQENPVVFGVNRIFRKEYQEYRPIHYYVAADRSLYQYQLQDIKALNPLRFFMYDRYARDANMSRLISFTTNTDYQVVSRSQDVPVGHNSTSPAIAVQLALMQGAQEIHFFGIDCRPSIDGKTHGHGNERRKEKQWRLITGGLLHVLEKLREYNVSYHVHSDLFEHNEYKDFRRQ